MTTRQITIAIAVAAILALPFTMASSSAETTEVPLAITLSSPIPETLSAKMGGKAADAATAVSADLFLPRMNGPSSPPWPAVVLLHGSSGFGGGYGADRAREFAEDGIAALVVYSHRSRGVIGRPGADIVARKVPRFAQLADAHAALAALSARTEIDARRIVLAGFSVGGKMAVLAALAPIARMFAPEGRRFAGHLSYWGICDTLFEDMATTGAPVRLLIGGRDDVTPEARCWELADNLQSLGSPTDLILYPGATHGWNGVSFAPVFLPERHNPSRCRWVLSGKGTLREETTGVAGGWHDPALAAGYRCLTRGYSVGFDATASARSRRDAVAFIKTLPPAPRRKAMKEPAR